MTFIKKIGIEEQKESTGIKEHIITQLIYVNGIKLTKYQNIKEIYAKITCLQGLVNGTGYDTVL
jgi:hypothetical protein